MRRTLRKVLGEVRHKIGPAMTHGAAWYRLSAGIRLLRSLTLRSRYLDSFSFARLIRR